MFYGLQDKIIVLCFFYVIKKYCFINECKTNKFDKLYNSKYALTVKNCLYTLASQLVIIFIIL